MVLIIVCTILGVSVGSFLNVIIYRLPFMMRHTSELSLRQPPAHCPECRHTLSAQDKIPLISYLLLKGKCRYCHATIHRAYPLIEATSAILSALLAAKYGLTLGLVGALFLVWMLIILASIDLTHFLLPDVLTYPLLWIGLAFNLLGIFTPLHAAVFGAMLGYLLLWSSFHLFKLLTGKAGMGRGDFKLLAACGAWLGYAALPAILLLSASSAIIIRLIFFRQQKNTYFAFGPYLCFATVIMLFWQR